MPELPEVETIKRDLENKILHQRILDVVIHDGRVVRGIKERSFAQRCRGQEICAITRRGKAIIITLEKGCLVVQPMMTGQLIFVPDTEDRTINKHTKVTFVLSKGGCLNYNDQRLFGRLSLVDDLNALGFFRTLGPEPFDQAFNPQFILKAISTRQAPIKNVLMDQRVVAGIGNIYASEILFRSKVDPQRPARTLRPSEIGCIHKATLGILEEAIRFRGTSMRDYRDASGQKGNFMERIKIYGREHESCFVCRTPVKRIVQAGRSTFYCKKCQK